jgi:quinoprotein glucose dehydrogenase
VCRGLRNPQELAFDQFGNLFADDNNCDRGDHARLVYVVEGGDCGWNMAYQTIPDPYTAGPWFAERMWHLRHKGQPAWIVPPVGSIGTGPSGFCFTSGTSLPERYRDRFFMCNYTGNGGIESFGVKPKGAGFEIVDYHDFLKPVMATDVDFGYDGKMYVSDFVNLLWDGGSAGGRIYTVFDPDRLKDPVVEQTKQLFKDGFRQRPDDELAKLLAHPDQRVRLRAQFTLAERGEKSESVLAKAAASRDHQLARLHAIWGLGQVARKHADALKPASALLGDVDAEVRAQTAKVIGDANWAGAQAKLDELLKDAEPRVRFFAAQSLGKLRYAPAVGPLFDLVRETGDTDPFLRHAAVAALANIGATEAIQARAKDPSPAVRLAVLLVQRRTRDAAVSQFLDDADPEIVTEAARAVHDLPIDSEMPRLARVLKRFGSAPVPDLDPLLRRVIHALYRSGKPEDAKAVFGVVTNPNFPLAVRAEALAELRDWTEPPPRDRVTGFWRPLPKRDPKVVRQVLEKGLPALLAKTSGKLQADAIALIAAADIKVNEDDFVVRVTDGAEPTGVRIASLRLLAARKSEKLPAVISTAVRTGPPQLKAVARDIRAVTDPAKAAVALRTVLEDETVETLEKQAALATLARLKSSEAGELLDKWAEQLADAKLPGELQLDAIEALKAAPNAKRTPAVQAFEASQAKGGPLGRFRVTLHGGDAERGREVFFGHAAAQCVRCHAVSGLGGNAGPDLSKVASRYPVNTREFLLESLVLPDAKIAPGFGTVTMTLLNGKIVSGTLEYEDADTVTVTTPEGKKVRVAKRDIDERTTAKSAMPPMDKVLGLRDMRDVIEYLTTLK